MLQLLLTVLLVIAVFVAIRSGLHVRGLIAVSLFVDVLGLAVDWLAATILGYVLSVLALIYITCAALGISVPGLSRRR